MSIVPHSSQENVRLDLAANGPLSDDAVKARIAKRLIGQIGPSTRAATTNWVDWGEFFGQLGQPFDNSSIPISKLEVMRRDPMLAFGLGFVKLPLIKASWYIEGTDAQRNAFVDQALRLIWGRLVIQWCNSLDYGFSPLCKRFEPIDPPDWTYHDNEDPDGKPLKVWQSSVQPVVWKPFLALNPKYSSPAWTNKGEFNGIYYGRRDTTTSFFAPGEENPKPEIPITHALWATNEKDSVFGSLWGYPRTGYAYRYWWAYWYRFGLADRAFEKWADPPVIAYHPVEVGIDDDGGTVNFTATALELAESLRSGANVAIPSSVVTSLDERPTQMREWSLEQMDVRTNFDALNSAFEYLDVAKVRALMVPEQALMEGRGGTSSRNVAGEMGDLLMQSQLVIMNELLDQINRFMIPQILEANFGSGGPQCRVCAKGFDPADMDVQRTLLQVVGQADPGQVSRYVDFRMLLEDLNIPILSAEAIQKRLDEQAQAAQAAVPPELAPGAGAGAGGGQAAGITPQGQYVDAPGRVTLPLEDRELEEQRLDLDRLRLDIELQKIEAEKDKVKLVLSEIGRGADSSGMTMADLAGALAESYLALENKVDMVLARPTPEPVYYIDVIQGEGKEEQ